LPYTGTDQIEGEDVEEDEDKVEPNSRVMITSMAVSDPMQGP
jgi:hypothetical protein